MQIRSYILSNRISFLLIFFSLMLASASYAITPIPQDMGQLEKSIMNYEAKLDKASLPEKRIYALLKLNHSIRKNKLERNLFDAIEIAFSVEGYKTDPELLAAIGAAYSFRASFYPNNIDQATYWFSKGTRMMDKAVSIEDNNVGARVYRGMSAINTPKYLNRTAIAIADFNFILNFKEIQPIDYDFRYLIVTNLQKAYEIVEDYDAIKALKEQHSDILLKEN